MTLLERPHRVYHNHVPRQMVRSGREARPDRLTLAVLTDIEHDLPQRLRQLRKRRERSFGLRYRHAEH